MKNNVKSRIQRSGKQLNVKLMLCCIAISMLAGAQQPQDSIRMTVAYGSEDKDCMELLRFQGIDYYQVKIAGAGLTGKNYSLVVKEIWRGRIRSVDTLLQTAGNPYLPKAGDTLQFSVMAARKGAKSMKIMFDFGRFSISNTFKCMRGGDYSLMDQHTEKAIAPGQSFYAFVCTLPMVESRSKKSYCALGSSDTDIEKWGKELGIRHYLLFEMKLE